MTSGPELPIRRAPVEGGGAVVVVDLGTVTGAGALVVAVVEGGAVVDAGPAPALVVGGRGDAPATDADADAAVVGDVEEPGDDWQPLTASAATSTTSAIDAGVAVRGRSVRAIGVSLHSVGESVGGGSSPRRPNRRSTSGRRPGTSGP
jgi:hypothetical protein